MKLAKRPFPICPKPLFQSEAKREAIGMKMIFFILMQIIFTRKVDSELVFLGERLARRLILKIVRQP